MDTLLNTIDDVKHKLTDAEYKALTDGLMEVHRAPPQQPPEINMFREVLPDDVGPITCLNDIVNAVETLAHDRDLWRLESDSIEGFIDWFLAAVHRGRAGCPRATAKKDDAGRLLTTWVVLRGNRH
jgi:hypothetical protein|eukprot:COSAG06_NODE_2818_length_6234_cov_4.107253_2_plen_126_part_00